MYQSYARWPITMFTTIVAIMLLSSVEVKAAHIMDFDDYAKFTPVSDLDYEGVTFSGDYWIGTGYPVYSNFLIPRTLDGQLTIEFDQPQGGFSFELYGALIWVGAYLDGEEVLNKDYRIENPYQGIIGEDDIIFDKLIIYDRYINNSFVMDNLVTVDPPEPIQDDRMNSGLGDANVAVIYPDGESVGVYSYETQSYIENIITPEDIPDTPPAENTIIRQEGNVTVSILTTGEIQFNLGPDAEGKTYTIIMEDLAGTGMYGSYYDPNE